MKTAQRLKLKGTPIQFILVCTDGSEKSMRGLLFKIMLLDSKGHSHHIEAIGLQKLSTFYPALRAHGIKQALQHLPHPSLSSLEDFKLSRKGGELDILIGTDLASLHPRPVANIKNLVISSSIFSTGWTLMGHNEDHIEIIGKEKGSKVNCCAVKNMKATSTFVHYLNANLAGTKDIQFLDAISNDSIGVTVAAKCKSCAQVMDSCKECKMMNESMTYLEYLEDKEIQSKIEYVPEEKKFIASYPYNQEVLNLLPNKDIAMKRTQNLEADLLRRPEDLDLINKTLKDSFDRGVFRFLSEEEINKTFVKSLKHFSIFKIVLKAMPNLIYNPFVNIFSFHKHKKIDSK